KSDDPAAGGADLSGSALITGALGGKPSDGYGKDSLRLLQLVSVPVSAQAGAAESVIGVLMAARAIDTAFAQSVKGASPDSIDVAFFFLDSVTPRVVASTIGSGSDITGVISRIQWPKEASPAPASATMRTTVQLAGVEYVALGAPLRTAAGSLIGGVVVFRNRDKEFAAFRRLEQ